ncbi:hypothetical protein Tco_0115374 [Tanacetum coccineum]
MTQSKLYWILLLVSLGTSGSILIPLPLSLIIERCASYGVLNSLGSCTTTHLALGLVVVVVVAAVVTNLGYIDRDVDVSLVDDTQRRSDDAYMFDIDDLHGDEVNVDMPVGDNQEQSVKEREVDTSVEDSAAPLTIEEITLALTLIQIKAAKPKVVTTATTTTTTTRPKARGVVVQEPSEFRTPQEA